MEFTQEEKTMLIAGLKMVSVNGINESNYQQVPEFIAKKKALVDKLNSYNPITVQAEVKRHRHPKKLLAE